jgi:ribosomal protein S18 acetylase RimI-like enzyme
MNKIFRGGENLHWQKMKKRDAAVSEALLRDRENWCVAACGRFLKHGSSKDSVWILRKKNAGVSALIIQAKRSLLPVFRSQENIPPLRFLRSFFGAVPVHSLQGPLADTVALENALMELGLEVKEQIDYDLMYIDGPPDESCFSAGPPNLILRRPLGADIDALAALQAGYEQEEVLPRGAVFHPAASRLNTEHILAGRQILAAEIHGRLVGKINVSALSFTRFLVGGVYVHPDFRGLGIARRMAAEFVRLLVAQGRGVTLFVKKSNPAARSVYRRVGFGILGDYRISYY